MAAGGPAWMQGAGVEERADLAEREPEFTVAAAGDCDLPGGRGVEPDDHAHGG